MLPFADRLETGVRRCGNPVLVGIDPHPDLLPEGLIGGGGPSDPLGRAEAMERFCCAVIDVVAPLVAAVKPQSAFFEQVGPEGMAVLAKVIKYAHQKGLLVILDVKRNDVGSTAAAYAPILFLSR